MIEVVSTAISEVKIIVPLVRGDTRGHFFESYKQIDFDTRVRECRFIQDNESRSTIGTLRGLHYQMPPFAQSKLVRVVKGQVLDVAVDIRKGSPTFGQHVAVNLSAENFKQLFVPRGFAHGFVALSEEVVFLYKVDNYYHPASERGIRFDDHELRIDWQIDLDRLILSEKDRSLPSLREAELFFYDEDLYVQ